MGRALWHEVGGNWRSHPGWWAYDPTGDSGCGVFARELGGHLDRQDQVRVWSLQPWVQFPSGQGGGKGWHAHVCVCVCVCACVWVRACVGVPSAPSRSDPALPAQIQAPAPGDIRILRGHQLSITCLVITPDDLAIFSAAKDCTIIKCEWAPGWGHSPRGSSRRACLGGGSNQGKQT